MADSEKQKMTARKRQLAKIEQLKARLQNEEAKLRSQARKDRDGQLIALGILFEQGLLVASQDEFNAVMESARKNLKGRTLERVLAAMERISRKKEELARKEEISPEPPSQLPEAEAQEKNQDSA